jgi:hypothetical protein
MKRKRSHRVPRYQRQPLRWANRNFRARYIFVNVLAAQKKPRREEPDAVTGRCKDERAEAKNMPLD